MRRIVIDTSSLVGAVLRAGSAPHRTWLRAQGSNTILACSQTLSEIERVLHRERLSRFVNPIARDRFLTLYRETVELIEVDLSQPLDPPCRDPKDHIFLALASAGDADVIVASDRDLLVLDPWNGIPILTPSQFLEQFSAGASQL